MSIQAIEIDASQYLTFSIEGEMYALGISQVREVLDVPQITKVPRTPDFMRGIINLRGYVAPVVDLKLKFGMGATEKTVNTRIIILEVVVDGEKTVMGILADSVREVTELEPDQIVPPPKIGTRLKASFIKGMGKQGNAFIIILDIDKVFSAEDLILVQHAETAYTEEAAETVEAMYLPG